MAKKFAIEDAFLALDEIIEQLEDENISLQDSMKYYKKGVKLLEQCNETLDKTQKEIVVLQEGSHV